MKKFLIFSTALLVAVLFVVVMYASSNPAPRRSRVSFVSVLTNSPATPTQTQTNVAPGIYSAKPYWMTVVVPKAVDEKMVVVTNTPESKMPAVKPELQLEKR